MANLLTITKEDNEQFSFVLNGDVATEIINTRNDLLTVGDECHFKTSNGSNLIKEQNVTWQNVTLIDGATTIIPTSVRNLFDELTALGFFDWVTGGGSGVDRFTDLLDTFDFTNQGSKFVRVNSAETQLEPVDVAFVTKSIELTDMPSVLTAGKMLKVNSTATAYELVDPPAGANGYVQAFTYTSPDPQEFTLATTAKLISVVVNGALADPLDWTQSGNLLTIINYTLVTNDRIIVTGVI